MVVTLTLQPVRLGLCYPVAVCSSSVGEKHISALTSVLSENCMTCAVFSGVCVVEFTALLFIDMLNTLSSCQRYLAQAHAPANGTFSLHSF